METPTETQDAPALTQDAPALTQDANEPSRDTDREGPAPGYGPPRQLPDKGDRMGRYVILRRLGAGGMGTVYLAYDPELDRKVALKLLHGPRRDQKRRTLLREAQALARLKDPNVVTVHDVGEHEGQVYVAMEFVEGRTLGRWLAESERSWREVLEVFLLAGRGLRAAHEQGLIHRDFKPDNVMVSGDGDVLVMDFGLARPSEESSDEDLDVSSLRVAALTATTVGRLAGTPAYMAPEQVGLEELSPAADQFAYCVSVWEALCGQRPFEGDSLAAIYTNISEGHVRAPPTGSMPRWLHRVLMRGLRSEPEARWPSMGELLDALDRGRRRWRWQVGLVVVAMGLALAGGAAVQQQQRAREHRALVVACEAEGAAIDEVWNDEERARLREGLLATETHFAERDANILIPWLDDYRDAWRSGRAEACMHDTVWRDWEADLLDRSAWCFEDRRIQLEATVEQIATSNRAAARRAVRLASYLDPVATCLDPTPLRRLPAPPMELRDEIRSVRAMLTESDSLRYSGRDEDALKVARSALAEAETLGWPPLRALARLIVGRRMFEGFELEHSDVELTRAYFEAQDAGSLEIAFRAARSLLNVFSRQGRHREAEVWARHARVLAPGLPDPSGLDEAEEHYLLNAVYCGQGDFEAAAREGELAVSMRTDVLGDDHPITAAARSGLGEALLMQGRADEALEHFDWAYYVWKDVLGPEHPRIETLARSRARALLRLKRIDDALEAQKERLAVAEAAFDEDHPIVGHALYEIGMTLTMRGDLDDAERMLQRAMAIYEARYGADAIRLGAVMMAMAKVDLARGLHDEALARCRRVLEIFDAVAEPDAESVAMILEQMAAVLASQGVADEAVDKHREALARLESSSGSDSREFMLSLVLLGDLQHEKLNDLEGARRTYQRVLDIGERVKGADTSVVQSLARLAEIALTNAELAEARRLADQAMAIVEAKHIKPLASALARFVLARVLAATEDPQRRAPALAEAARATFALAYDERRFEVEAWLKGEREVSTGELVPNEG